MSIPTNPNKRKSCQEACPSQVKQMKTTEHRPFRDPGQYEDEVSLTFSDGQVLFVSRMLLCHMSPVFEGMLKDKSSFKESEEKKVNMVGKTYHDMLELLLQAHPRIQAKVTEDNVFKILPLAEEYMIDGTVAKCREVLLGILVRTQQQRYIARMYNEAEDMDDVVDVLVIARRYDYGDICDRAIKAISRSENFPNNWKSLYRNICDADKLKILETRLRRANDKIIMCTLLNS